MRNAYSSGEYEKSYRATVGTISWNKISKTDAKLGMCAPVPMSEFALAVRTACGMPAWGVAAQVMGKP